MFRSSAARAATASSLVVQAPAIAQPSSLIEINRSRVQVRQVRQQDRQWLPALCELLVDGVHHGASLGFLAPMAHHVAMDYWDAVFARLGSQQALWIALESDDGPLRGCVQLGACPHAHHRGEVRQMMVHSRSRGRGIASQLMSRLECTALEQGRTLLVLETPSDSQAEAVYAHLGWQRAGEIPESASCAEGRLHASAMYYKRLR